MADTKPTKNLVPATPKVDTIAAAIGAVLLIATWLGLALPEMPAEQRAELAELLLEVFLGVGTAAALVRRWWQGKAAREGA